MRCQWEPDAVLHPRSAKLDEDEPEMFKLIELAKLHRIIDTK